MVVGSGEGATSVGESPLRRAGKALAATGIAFTATGLLMFVLGINPFDAYIGMVGGAFGSTANFGDTIAKTVPIALIAVGVALTFRCGLWNAGGEGQLYCGAVGAVIVGINMTGPPIPTVLAEMGAGLFAGGLAGLVPAVLKVRFGANEILVTLMLNFIGILLAQYLITGPYASGSTSATRTISAAAQLPWAELAGIRVHAGVAFAAAAAIAVFVITQRTTFGYRIKAIGSNRDAARSAGINVGRMSIASFVIAGSLAGLAGMVQVAAVHYSLPDNFSPGFGFSAIIAALLGRLHPIGSVLASFALAALFVGAQAMQRSEGVPATLVLVIEGALLISLLAFRVVAFGLFQAES